MAMTILLVYMILAVRRLREHPAFKWNLMLLFCLLSYTFRVQLGAEWGDLPHLFNTFEYLTPVMFMLAIQFNFDDDFQIGKIEWIAIAVLGFLLVLFLFGKPNVERAGIKNWFVIFQISLQYGLIAFCVMWAYWNTFRTWSNDLLELRRKGRLFFVCLIGPAILLGVLLYYISFFHSAILPYIDIFVSAGIIFSGLLAFAIFGHLSFQEEASLVNKGFSLKASSNPLKTEQKPQFEASEQAVLSGTEVALNQEYQRLISTLAKVMVEDKRYLESDLSIGKLAQYVGVPEYKLRVAINKVLGYKNFNAYLNAYRIAEAKGILEDPENAEPILNISLDCGYLNQSTFHKAFREDTKLTPSEYREKHQTSHS